MKLAGKVALVSGGHRGIGEAVVRRFAAEGAHVGIADVNLEAGENLAKEMTELGHSVTFLKLDVTSAADWDQAVKSLTDKYGQLDILINNAGVYQRKPMHEISEEDWDLVMGVNGKGVFLGCKAVLEAMKRGGGGSIVNISSILGKVISRKFTVFLTATGLMVWSDLTSDTWGMIAIVYIGGQSVIDAALSWKHGKDD